MYVVWGSTYLGIKVSIETMPPLVSASARFIGAALLLGLVIAAVKPAALRMTRSQAGTAALSGILLLVGGNGMVVVAEERISSGLAALLVSTTPLWVVVLRTLLGDRPSGATVLGIAVGFGGVAILIVPGGFGGDIARSLLVVAAALSWAAGSLLTVRRAMPENPFAGSVVQMAAGGLVLAVLGVGRGELRGFTFDQVSGRSWFALLYLLVAGSVIAFTAYVWVLGKLPVSTVTTYAYVNPVIAVGLGVLLLGETVGVNVLIGGAVIVLAVAVVVTAEGRQRRAVAAPPPAPVEEPSRAA